MDFRTANAAYTKALDALGAVQDELGQAEYEYEQESRAGNTAALSAIRSRIDIARSKLPAVNAAADVAEANYTAAKAEYDRTQQSEQAKATPTAAALVEETTPSPAPGPPPVTDTGPTGALTAQQVNNIETADDPQDAITQPLPPAGNNPDEASAQEPATASTAMFTVNVDGYPKIPEIKPNPLHNFNNSTYLFSLHLLDKDNYNALVASRQQNSFKVKFKTDNILIASGGKTAGRNPEWKENFFIENLDMTTVIGLTSQYQGSNAVTIKFTIIEPNGVSLIERLIKSFEGTSYLNYLEMAYAMQIDFIGYDDQGTIVNLPNHTKYLPIKFTGITFKVSERGTEYSVSAVPYNHVGFNSSYAASPIAMSITAATVDDYFTDFGQATPQRSQQSQAQTFANITNKKPEYINAASYCNAVNKFEQSKKKIDGYIPDIYNVIFDDDISGSKLSSVTDKTIAEITNTPMQQDANQSNSEIQRRLTARNNSAVIPQNGDPTLTAAAPGEVEYTAVTYNINAGTSLVSEINRIVRNSEFLLEQLSFDDTSKLKKLTDAELKEAALKKKVPLRWWKVIPDVQLLEFDRTRNTYAKKITYFVKSYLVESNQYPGIPKRRPLPRKAYNYLFTGKNLVVITFNWDFNTTYYVAVSADLSKNSSTSNSANTRPENDPKKQETDKLYGKTNLANTAQQFMSGNNAGTAGAGAKRDAVSTVTADIQTQLFSRPSGDLVMLDMTIIGDPDFIKQDDIFSGVISAESQLNGSMPMDTGEVYITVDFLTPADFSDDTGLPVGQTRSKFSGIYRVLTVNNSFQSGKFTQKLNAVRIFLDGIDDVDTGPVQEKPVLQSSVTASQQVQLKDPAVGTGTDGTAGEQRARQAITTETTRTPAGNNPDEAESSAESADNTALAAVAATSPTVSITVV